MIAAHIMNRTIPTQNNTCPVALAAASADAGKPTDQITAPTMINIMDITRSSCFITKFLDSPPKVCSLTDGEIEIRTKDRAEFLRLRDYPCFD